MGKPESFDFQIKTIARREQSRITGIYQALGYEVTNIAPSVKSKKHLDVTLKRVSNIAHKAELEELEKEIQTELATINELKRGETKAPKINAYVLGTVATLTLGGGMSLVMEGNSTATFVSGVIVGIVGLIFCAVNDLIYRKFVSKRQNQNYNKVQAAYHKIDSNCEKAQALVGEKE